MTISLSVRHLIFPLVSLTFFVVTYECTGCGGDVTIGKGTSSLGSGDGSSTSDNPDPGGVCTRHACDPPRPGDCPLAKCADYGLACAYGKIVHARCVPDPYAGSGSAPADQCVVIGDCNNERMPDLDAGAPCDDASECGRSPSCVSGTLKVGACISWPVGSDVCTWNYRCE